MLAVCPFTSFGECRMRPWMLGPWRFALVKICSASARAMQRWWAISGNCWSITGSTAASLRDKSSDSSSVRHRAGGGVCERGFDLDRPTRPVRAAKRGKCPFPLPRGFHHRATGAGRSLGALAIWDEGRERIGKDCLNAVLADSSHKPVALGVVLQRVDGLGNVEFADCPKKRAGAGTLGEGVQQIDARFREMWVRRRARSLHLLAGCKHVECNA